MKNHHDSSSPNTELLHDLQGLVAEAQTLIAESATEQSAAALEALRSRFTAAQERLAEAYAGARKKVIAGAKCTDEAIRADPYQSIAVAAGVGLLVGVLLGRRSK